MSHPCIVQFYGSALHEGVVNIITEFLEKGSLDNILYENKEPMPWVLRTKMALVKNKKKIIIFFTFFFFFFFFFLGHFESYSLPPSILPSFDS